MIERTKIKTGFPAWDEINGGGLFPGLYVIGGGNGQCDVHMVELICRLGNEINVGVVSNELDQWQLLKMVGCGFKSYKKAVETCAQTFDTPDIHEFEKKARDYCFHGELEVIIVDSLTSFTVSDLDGSRYNLEDRRMSRVLNVFQSLSKELKVPIILYVKWDGHDGLIPEELTLDTLPHIDRLEEMAFQIAFIHEPEFIIAKHRDGHLGRIKLY